MKILHLNYSDSSGGAAIAVNRIHNLLLKENFNSKILVNEKLSNSDNVLYHKSTLKHIRGLIYDSISRKILNNLKNINKDTSNSLCLYPTGLHKKINDINPDIVNFHWLGNSMISLKEISKIKAPIVWTLHDMWPMCGIEHYSTNTKYFTDYNNSSRKILDIDEFVWRRKIKFFKNIKKVICTSDWMYKMASDSIIFKDKKIKEIPLTLDTDFWKPQNKIDQRKNLNIGADKKVITFGADNFLKNNRKGFNFFSECVKKFLNDEKYTIILFGETKDIDIAKNSNNVLNLGFVKDKYTLRMIFSSTDVMVVPSLIESFGMIALEALHCGTPSVVFDDTGLTSITEHKVNGYISKHKSSDDLRNGVEWLLNNKDLIKNNINKSIEKFSNKSVVNNYINFLKE